jgi:hypothetical protein
VDLQKLFYQYTLDSFGKIGFGIEINSLSMILLNRFCGFH